MVDNLKAFDIEFSALSIGKHQYSFEVDDTFFGCFENAVITKVKLANFWGQDLPKQTSVVFVFLLDKYMERLDVKLKDQSHKLQKPLNLISFAFKIPGKDPTKIKGGMFLYGYKIKG